MSANRKTVRISLIEDDPDDAQLLHEFLSEATDIKFIVHNFNNLSDGLKHFSKNKPDAVLLDLNLPDSRGLETLKRLRKENPHVPIVVISGLQDQLTAMEAVRLGAQDYLVKGIISAPTLRRVLLYTIERNSLHLNLQQNIESIQKLIEKNVDGIVVVDTEGVILFANPGAASLFGVETKKLIGQSFGYPLISGESTQITIPRPNKQNIFAEMRVVDIHWQDKPAFLISLHNITERYLLEKRLRATNRAYKTLSKCNEQLFHAKNEKQLLENICKILIHEGGYCLAWVGYAENDKNKTVRPVAYAGYEEGYPETVQITWADTELGRGPTGTAIRTGQPVFVQNIQTDPLSEPWRQDALKHGYNSSIALPLIVENQIIGALNIYSREPEAFDEEEIRLLKELTDNLSFGIQALRTRKEKETAELALRESEERYRNLFNNVPIGLYISSPDMSILEVNPFLVKMLGFPDKETLRSFVKQGNSIAIDREQWRELLKRDGEIKNVETRWRRYDGKIIWVKESTRIARDEDGNLLYYEGAAEDITEQKEAEQALRESEERYRNLFNRVPVGLYRTTPEGKILDVNPFLVEMLGYPDKETLLSINVKKGYVKSRQREQWKRKIETEKEIRNYEIQWRCYDGRVVWVKDSARVIKDEQGNILYYEGVAEDITERKRIEEELIQTNRKLKRLLDSSSAVIYILKPNKSGKSNFRFIPVSVTDNVKTVFGYEPEDFIGVPEFWLKRIHPDDKERIYRELLKTTHEGKHSYEYRWKRKDGSYCWIYDLKQVIYDEKGEIVEIIGSWLDITEKKKLEQQYLRAQRMESIGTLAGGIAHDLNNILTPILLATEVLRYKLLDEKSENVLKMIETSAKRGSELIKQVLSFSRGGATEHTVVQLKHIIKEIAKIINETFPKSVNLHTDLPNNLWQVIADGTQLHQVIMNLCVNARDAMPDGGILEIKAENIKLDQSYSSMRDEAKPGPYVKITVTDTGKGIPSRIMDKIFDPFFTTKEVGKGTGLGLATVHSIIKNHGGFVNVYSEVGKGTAFSIYLPAKEETGTEEAKEKEEIFTGNGELILVVDDEAAIREITRTTLESNGYKVITAADGTEAVAIYARQKEKIDLVITDMSMPFMDGNATIHAMKKLNPRIKIIAVSGRAESDCGLTKESVTFLSKPFSAETLLKSVHETLRKI
ncbi:MAG: PAS domain S-box protein [Calditrichaeota bacterium]|nr:PAS domain S-box protein [Calditrichota bacterium]